MHNLTIAQMIRELRSKTFSSVELTEHFLTRIQSLDSTYNSFISVTPELALAHRPEYPIM